jgi:GNAT superfamily N-acetyltransferase
VALEPLQVVDFLNLDLMSSVKRLTAEELPRIRRLGKMFADEVKLAGGYVPAAHESIWRPLMLAGLADVFYTEDGMGELTGFLGASYVPDLYSGVSGAQAQFWFVDANHRSGSVAVRLFDAFEKEAARRNTLKYSVGHKIGIHEDAMGNFFQRRGYSKGEVFYWKNLC